MFKIGLLVLCLSTTALAERTARGAEELLGFFGSQCITNGSFASEALAQSKTLIQSLEAIKDDPDCTTVSGIMGQLKSLDTYAFQLANEPEEVTIAALEREEEEIQRAIQTASPEQLVFLQSRLLSIQLESAQLLGFLDARLANQRLYEKRQSVATFNASMKALLSQTSANMTCWAKHPSILQGIGQLAGAAIASSSEASLALPLQGLVNLTGTIVEAARTMKINRYINNISLNIRKNAYMCTLERLSNTWCSAYEGQQAIQLEQSAKDPKSPEDSRWQGLSLLNTELIVLREWLSVVRSGSEPSSVDIGEQKSEFYKREQIVLSTEANGIGLILSETQVWEAVKSNLPRVWTLEKNLINELTDLVYYSGGTAPTTERWAIAVFPYYLLGFFDNPAAPIPIPKNQGLTLSFSEFDPIVNTYPGYSYVPSLTAIENRFKAFIQEAKGTLEFERATKVQLDPGYILDSFISDAESYGKPSPQTSAKKIVQFMKDQLVATNGLPAKYRTSYASTIARLETIISEVDLYYDNKKTAVEVLRAIYSAANLLAGVRDLIAPIERAIRISLNTEVIDQLNNDQLLGIRLLAAKSVVDQLSLYTGRDSTVEITTELAMTMSASQSNILNFIDYFSEGIVVALKDYDDLASLASEGENGQNRMIKNHLCLLLASNNQWPKSIPFKLCEGAQLTSYGGALKSAKIEKSFFVNRKGVDPQQEMAKRVCASREYYRKTRILNKDFTQLY